MSDGNSSRDRS